MLILIEIDQQTKHLIVKRINCRLMHNYIFDLVGRTNVFISKSIENIPKIILKRNETLFSF